MSNCEEHLGQIQNTLEGLYIPSGLGIPWDLPEITRGNWGRKLSRLVGFFSCNLNADTNRHNQS